MKVTRSVNMLKELWQEIEKIAQKNKRSVSATIELAVEEYLKKQGDDLKN